MVKTRRRQQIVEVKHQVIFGATAPGDQGLAACGWRIKTVFVARLNLSLRQRGAAIGRRSAPSWKSDDGLH